MLLALVLTPQTRVGARSELSNLLDNSQLSNVVKAPTTLFLPKARGGADSILPLGANTLIAQMGPLGTSTNAKESTFSKEDITTYTVRDGDTLGHIAELFDISVNTIRWQNNLSHNAFIKKGQKLIILPADGVTVKVAKGDTITALAKKYKADEKEIKQFNNISNDAGLTVGVEIIIPGGEPVQTIKVATKKPTTKAPSTKTTKTKSSSTSYIDPLKGKGVLTQKFHGRWRAIDIGAPTGTPIYASKAGTVVVDNNEGWGGGYGNYVVLKHANGAKTLYAHMVKNSVKLGQYIAKGEQIGQVGSTGRSTGPHIHFEIRDDIDVPYSSWGR